MAQTFAGQSNFSNPVVNIGTSTATATYGLGAGATLNGNTKTVNIATGGVTGSTAVVNIGSAGGGGGQTVIHTPTVTFANTVTAIGANAANLSVLWAGIGGATADANNRLSVNTRAVLLNNAGASIRATLNKAAAGDDAALSWQTGFSNHFVQLPSACRRLGRRTKGVDWLNAASCRGFGRKENHHPIGLTMIGYLVGTIRPGASFRTDPTSPPTLCQTRSPVGTPPPAAPGRSARPRHCARSPAHGAGPGIACVEGDATVVVVLVGSVLMIGLFRGAVLALSLIRAMGAAQDSQVSWTGYLNKALAEQGDASAENSLGLPYARGEGVPQDQAEAAKWWILAAEQGYAEAQANHGVAYYTTAMSRSVIQVVGSMPTCVCATTPL